MAYCCTCAEDSLFQSTPPVRGATDIIAALASGIGISIHAPREGATVPWWQYAEKQQFQSTPPTRGATWVHPEGRFAVVISIHAPHEGGDFRQFTGG